MDSEYLASKLSLLPAFTVTSVRTDTEGALLVEGHFSPSGNEDETSMSLFLADGRYMQGSLLRGVGLSRTVKIDPSWNLDILPEEIPGKIFACFGSYDARDLQLALNPEINWEQITFKPQTAIASRITGTDGKSYRKLELWHDDPPIPEESSLIERGWDHEHCKFCWQRIGDGDIGYRSTGEAYGNEWACQWCFEHAISIHDPRPLLLDYRLRA